MAKATKIAEQAPVVSDVSTMVTAVADEVAVQIIHDFLVAIGATPVQPVIFTPGTIGDKWMSFQDLYNRCANLMNPGDPIPAINP